MNLILYLIFFTNNECLECHEVKVGEVHRRLGCVQCHSDITELPHNIPAKKVRCVSCHEEIEKIWSLDIHVRRMRIGKRGTPDCKDCHGTHLTESPSVPQSKLNPKNMPKFCSQCHGNVLPLGKYHIVRFSKKTCLECHERGEYNAQIINVAVLENSSHKGFECMDCHGGVKSLEAKKGHAGKFQIEYCSQCHRDSHLDYVKSSHFSALKRGNYEAATCWDCHGTHNVLAAKIETSMVFYRNIPETCGKCHSVVKMAQKYKITVKNPYQLFMESIHFQKVLKGERGAVCIDCHTYHKIKGSSSSISPIYKVNLPETCGKCHEKEKNDFIRSSHFESLLLGNFEAPSCNDCHMEHRIMSTKDPKATVSPLNIFRTCSECHERTRVSEKFGLPLGRLSSFMSSYHGLALRSGRIEAANCASCHGYHLVLPSTNPNAPTNPNNIPKTCGECHTKMREVGLTVKIHEDPNPLAEKLNNFVRIFYTFLIVYLISFMLLYCFLDFRRKIKDQIEKASEYELIWVDNVRFNRWERILHFIHLISFFVLVYTGFARRYPENMIFAVFRGLGGEITRAYLHRIFGTLLILVFLLKVVLMVSTKRGRIQFKNLLFNSKDFKDFIDLFLFNVGIRKEPINFNHPYGFHEKFEYWALVWGTLLMGITGILVWFKEQSLSFMQLWVLELMLLIHFYEAVLTSLTILVWHLYWVLINPDIYPYNLAMFYKRYFLRVRKVREKVHQTEK